MLREIRKKMIILKNRMPFDPDIKNYFVHVGKMDWLYENMYLEGSYLAREQVEEIASGNVLMNFTLDEHVMIQNLETLLDKLYGFADMKRSLGTHLLEDMYSILYSSKESPYRKRNIICYQWDYTPPHPAEIGECMTDLNQLFAKAMEARGESEEFFEYAERIHNSIIAVEPFKKGNTIIARAAMIYYLMAKGYPVAVPQMKEDEYNRMVAGALKTGDLQGFNHCIKKEILDRMMLMIQLTAH